MLFEHIVFPVDLSAQSHEAAPFVRGIAKRFNADVTLLHVFEIPMAWCAAPEIAAFDAVANMAEVQEQRASELESFQAREFPDVQCVRVMAEGDAAGQITCCARSSKPALIMMPTHGYGTFRRLLLGSVTAKVLHDSEAPVWTGVHRSEAMSHDAQNCRRIVCAIDTNARDAHVLPWVKDFANRNGAEVVLVHSIEGFSERSVETDRALYDFLYGVARDQMKRFQADAGTSFEVAVVPGHPETVVHNIAGQREADLVVIGRGAYHGMGRLRSHDYAIICESPCPVISV